MYLLCVKLDELFIFRYIRPGGLPGRYRRDLHSRPCSVGDALSALESVRSKFILWNKPENEHIHRRYEILSLETCEYHLSSINLHLFFILLILFELLHFIYFYLQTIVTHSLFFYQSFLFYPHPLHVHLYQQKGYMQSAWFSPYSLTNNDVINCCIFRLAPILRARILYLTTLLGERRCGSFNWIHGQ